MFIPSHEIFLISFLSSIFFPSRFGLSGITFEDILFFFTGATHVPPLGFTPDPILTFDGKAHYPTASLNLCLPTMYHDDYATFKAKLVYAFKHHGCFGLI